MKKLARCVLLSTGVICSFASSGPVLATDSSPTGNWQHSVSLYAWLPALDGEFKYQRDNGESLPIDSSQILDALNMTFMGAYEARKDKWVLLGDLIYLNLSNDKDRETIGYSNVDMRLKGWQVGLYGGYNQTGPVSI